MLGKLKTSHLFALSFALLLGSITFINWTRNQLEFISKTSPDAQLAQVYPIPVWTQPNPGEHVLIVYNNNPLVPDSAKLKDYYLANRPGFSNANVLGVNTVTTLQDISEAEYNTTIRDPIITWLQENKKDKPIRYIVMMYGLPTRIPNINSVDYRVSTALQSLNLRTGMEYRFPADIYAYSTQFTPEAYLGTTALVTRMDMGTPEATKAYINKIKTMGPGNIIISPRTNTGTYYFDDARGYENESSPPGILARDAILGENPSASIDYHPNLGSTTANNVYSASNVKGYMSWGAHASLGDDYANNGLIKFSGNSGWYIIQTIESYNGVRFYNDCGLTCQGSFVDWFAANAFGGTNYENTPIGAVVHVQEPWRAGVNSEKYFGLWERGYLFVEAAWASRNTEQLMVIGDPLITSHPSTLNATKPIPIATLTADPVLLQGSGISTLKWSSPNAQFCTPKGGTFGASLSDKIEIYGTWRVVVTTDTTYSLTCTGTGGDSTPAQTTISIAPLISAISVSSISTNSATISWSVNKPVTSTVLYGPTTGYGSQTTASNLNTQILTGLQPNQTYHYQIKSTDSNNNISLSPDKTFDTLNNKATTDTTPPSVPTNALAVLDNGNNIRFSWNGSNDSGGSGVAGYKPYRNDILRKNTTMLSVYDDALPENETFCWSVSAYDNDGNISSKTPNSCVTIPPHIPTITSFTATPSSIVSGQSSTLKWSTIDAVSCTASGGWTGAKITSGTQTVMPTTDTTYSIRCKNELTGYGPTTSKTVTVTSPANNIPTLSAIGPKTIAEGSQLTFTITGSDNDVTDTLTYSATNLPTGATFTPSTKTFSFTPTYTQSGSYTTPTFTVSDGKGGTDTETITITVSNTNLEPVARAGSNQAIILPTVANLSASASSDPDTGTTLTYTWSKDSGPGTVTFSTPNTVGTTATFSAEGIYVLKVIASDGFMTGTDTITVAVDQPLPADSDNDGVINTLDKCSSTPISASSQVNTLGCPKPKTTKFTVSPDMNTTDLNSVTGLKLTNTFGSIEFTSAVSLIRNSNQIDIDLNTNIFQGGVSISSNNLAELNKPARITLYNISATNPIILKDGTICGQCTEISHSSNTFIFTVPGFSTYTVISNTPTPTAILNASPTTITAGNSSTITWSSNNSTSCTASGGWTGTKNTSGTQTVSPTVTTIYSILCGGSGGLSSQVSKTVTVTPAIVIPDPVLPPNNYLPPPPQTYTEPVNQSPTTNYDQPIPTDSSTQPITVYKLYRNLKLNDQGDDVLLLQKTLNKLGYIVTENSIFDKQTSDALEMYQENKTSTGIDPSGNLDNTTIVLLNYDISNLSLLESIVETSDPEIVIDNSSEKSFLQTFILRVSTGFNNFIDLIIGIL